MIVETTTSSLTEKAVAAMRAAVARVVEDHRRRGKPLVVWRDGRGRMKRLAPLRDELLSGDIRSLFICR